MFPLGSLNPFLGPCHSPWEHGHTDSTKRFWEALSEDVQSESELHMPRSIGTQPPWEQSREVPAAGNHTQLLSFPHIFPA